MPWKPHRSIWCWVGLHSCCPTVTWPHGTACMCRCPHGEPDEE